MSEVRKRADLMTVRDSVRLAPFGLYSGVVGWSARRTVPRPIRKALYGAFSRCVGVDLSEAEKELVEYPTFDTFFSRRLRAGARELAAEPGAILSPSDGTVSAFGEVQDGQVIQAKGLSYSVAGLLGDDALAARFIRGSYLTVYLSPRDYHRVHTPLAARIVKYRHIPGQRLPVNPRFVAGVDGLFTQNERLIVEFESGLGKVALVMVAAAGVGNLVLYTPPVEFRGLRRKAVTEVALQPPIAVTRGQELGAFLLGSTVIVLFEAGKVQFQNVNVGDALRQGAAVGYARAGGGHEQD